MLSKRGERERRVLSKRGRERVLVREGERKSVK